MSHRRLQVHADTLWLFRLCLTASTAYLGVMGLVTTTTILSLFDPLVVRWLVDYVIPRGNAQLLVIAVCLIVGAYVVRLALHTVATSLNQYAGHVLAFRLRVRLVRRIFGASQSFIADRGFSDLVSRVEQDVTRICELGAGVVITLLRMLLTLGSTICVMLYLNWKLTAFLLPTMPMFMFVRRYYRRRIQDAAERTRIDEVRQRSFLHDVLMGVPDIQLAGAERQIVSGYGLRLRTVLKSEIITQRLELWFGIASSLVISSGIAVVFAYGGHEVFRGALTVGGLIAFYSYFFRLFDPLSNAVETTTRLQRIWGSIGQVRELEKERLSLHTLSSIRSANGELPSRIVYDNVGFSYPNGRVALTNFSTEFRRGELIAIVGTNGSGKTTIVRLLSRLYDATVGMIFCDGRDIRDVDIRRWRKLVAVVQQKPALFAMSFRENIELGSKRSDPTRLQWVLEASGLSYVLRRFPKGLEELIGDGGSRLSGGEAQRLALARALLTDKPILLLDEATSALDPTSETEILCHVRNLCRDRITVCVTHRSEALKVADRVILLDNGRAVLDGHHTELWRSSQRYRDYWKSLEYDSKRQVARWEHGSVTPSEVSFSGDEIRTSFRS
jgi:ATP-binding cassette, subfamily B, bacterial